MIHLLQCLEKFRLQLFTESFSQNVQKNLECGRIKMFLQPKPGNYNVEAYQFCYAQNPLLESILTSVRDIIIICE